MLRAAGVVEADGQRAARLRLRAREEVLSVLLAADHLAGALVAADAEAQGQQTRKDRKLAVRGAPRAPDAACSEQEC